VGTGAPSDIESVRLAELVAALSLGIDLGFGQPMEHVLRQCVLSLRLADRLGLSDADRSVVYYTSLLVNVGCHADAHEQAKWFGDDIAMKAVKYSHGLRTVGGAVATLRLLGSGGGPLHRFRVGLEFAVSGHRDLHGMIDGHAELARRLAADLGLSDAVQTAVGSAYEQWDGKGWPGRLAGRDVPLAARVTQLAEYLEVAQRVRGTAAAVALASDRAGSQFDPEIAAVVRSAGEELFAAIDDGQTWDAVVSAEPALTVVMSTDEFDRALGAVADFVDLKSPYQLGHARAVARLVADAAAQQSLARDEQRRVVRAALVHGFGRLGVSNAIWDKAGPLGAGEWERVRLHPYLTERMLRQSRALAPIGALAVQVRERLDGSGYPRGLTGASIAPGGRLLAAADAYQAMIEPRPHRPPHSPVAAAAALRTEVRAGRLDGAAVDAVLAAAGHRIRKRRDAPAGLTAREVEVLRLVARGTATREIAARLHITPKTARNHIEHIYAKLGVTSRVTAGLFAVQHGLVPEDVAPAG
jgi:HD-GYP domain-containing protein (c-di-GMP phosphodiesterase class II)